MGENTVRVRVAKFLQWMVQHEHHYGGWRSYSDTDPPEKWHSFELRGHGHHIRVPRSTMEAARGLYAPAGKGTRMFYPTEAGFALIRDVLPLPTEPEVAARVEGEGHE